MGFLTVPNETFDLLLLTIIVLVIILIVPLLILLILLLIIFYKVLPFACVIDVALYDVYASPLCAAAKTYLTHSLSKFDL